MIKRILEKIDEILYDIKENSIMLYEMSQPQAKVRENIRNLSKPIFKHLIKVILYGKEESNTLHHWANELNNWLDQCMDDKIKKNGKDRYPNYRELITWVTEYYKTPEDIERMRSNIERQYQRQGHSPRENITNKQLHENIINILKETCTLAVENTNTDDKIINIIEKYTLA